MRALPFGMRVGVTGVVLALLLGVWSSLGHLVEHHQKRDGVAGVSYADLQGAYHGIDRPAPLAAALERGHPEELAPRDRELLLAWLRSGRIAEGYDDPDLGPASPAEVLDRACLGCHARQAQRGDGIGAELPLEYFDDVKRLAFAQRIEPLPREVLLASTHTHALSMATLTLAVLALLWATRWPAFLKSAAGAAAGIGLALDLFSWWLARDGAGFVALVIAGGSLWTLAIVGGALCALAELWLPLPRPRP